MNDIVALLEKALEEGPNSDKQWLLDKMEDYRRRMSASAMHCKRGRPRICSCGTCAICKRRERIIKNRKAKLAASSVAVVEQA